MRTKKTTACSNERETHLRTATSGTAATETVDCLTETLTKPDGSAKKNKSLGARLLVARRTGLTGEPRADTIPAETTGSPSTRIPGDSLTAEEARTGTTEGLTATKTKDPEQAAGILTDDGDKTRDLAEAGNRTR